jgi:hypothetical protein
MVRPKEEESGYRSPPKPVRFKYPEGRTLEGEIQQDGEIYRDMEDQDGCTYRKCIQLVLVRNGEEEKMLRFTYYRKPKGGRWLFAGQTSPLFEIEAIQELLKEAVAKGWIRL